MRCARSPASAMTGLRARGQEYTCADGNPGPHVRSFAVEGRGLELSLSGGAGRFCSRRGLDGQALAHSLRVGRARLPSRAEPRAYSRPGRDGASTSVIQSRPTCGDQGRGIGSTARSGRGGRPGGVTRVLRLTGVEGTSPERGRGVGRF